VSAGDVNLSRTQVKAIRALLDHSRIQDAAKSAGVSERTLYRWLGDPLFVAAMRKAETQSISDHVRALVVDLEQNRRVMYEIRDNARFSPNVRLRAAVAIRDDLLKWRQLEDLEDAIFRLEERINEIENRQTNKKS